MARGGLQQFAMSKLAPLCFTITFLTTLSQMLKFRIVQMLFL